MTMTAHALLPLVKAARGAARAEAKDSFPWIRSRGTWLCTAGPSGQCGPRPEAEACWWNGRVAEIREVVATVVAKHPDVDKVYLAGGFDGADTFEDLYRHDNYEPWVSAWDVTVWTRADGFLLDMLSPA
jgi:hypothetical protein